MFESEEEREVERIWKEQVEEENMRLCLSRECALCQSKWIVGTDQIAARLRWIRPHLLFGISPYLRIGSSLFHQLCDG